MEGSDPQSALPAGPSLPSVGGLKHVGRFEILCPLAQGGMAVLYLARTAGIGGFERLFALKLIHEHLSREERFVHMFLDEARLAARIRHPNVVPVYEVGVHEERHYLAMEYLSGETLGMALTTTWPKGVPFPLSLVPLIIGSAAEGLHAAHELRDANGASLGVIHRDVTPQNIMLGYDGSVRVMDFGVARALDQLSESLPGTFKGTPAYMAPEQVRSGAIDRRADIFALGIILWEMTVGKRLFKDKNDITTTMNVLQREIVAPSKVYPGYPAELEAIVMKALNRDPERRFDTARDLAEALQEFELGLSSRAGAGNLERWMSETFPSRIAERRRFEKVALDPGLSRPLRFPSQLAPPPASALGAQQITPDLRPPPTEDEAEATATSVAGPVELGLGTPPPARGRPRRGVFLGFGAGLLLVLALAGSGLFASNPKAEAPATTTAEPTKVETARTPVEVGGAPTPSTPPEPTPTPTPAPPLDVAASPPSTPRDVRAQDGAAGRTRARRARPKASPERSWPESDEIYQGSDL